MKHLITPILFACLAVFFAGCAAQSSPKPQAGPAIPPAPSHPQFDRIRALAGSWAEMDKNGAPTGKKTHYEVTAGGSAVIETIFPGTPKEMVTMYHLDGDTLMLTHYCVLQNQPRMRAAQAQDSRVIRFEFTDGTNMTSTLDSHMHEAVFTFIDDDHYSAKWSHYENGAPVHAVAMNMVRQ